MDDKKYPRTLSDREMREWIPACPVQIKRIRLSQESEGAPIRMTVFSVPCIDQKLTSYTAEVRFQTERREPAGEPLPLTLSVGESGAVEVPFEKAVFASAEITSVTYASGEVWRKPEGVSGRIPPDQAVFWQTDPLYDAIRRECEGVVEAKYAPDELDGAWRCACGQINLNASASCGGCGCSREWLKTHLDPAYLTERMKEADVKTEQVLKKEKKRRDREISDRNKAIAIFAAIGILIGLVIFIFAKGIPDAKYRKAASLEEAGEYEEAAARFTALDGYRDSKERAAEATYRRAQVLTGLEEVYMTTSVKEPWFTIDADGVLSFNKDKYEKKKNEWNHFVIPDVVDGVMVRELDRNFLMNCKEMTVVTVSDCVEVIGEQAFFNCEALHTVNFGKSVREIGPRAFINCASLEEIKIPDTVETLGLRAFNKCTALRKIVLGKGITAIGAYTFSYCISLEDVTLCAPVERVDEFAFSECQSLTNIFCRFDESDGWQPSVAEENEPWHNAHFSYGN